MSSQSIPEEEAFSDPQPVRPWLRGLATAAVFLLGLCAVSLPSGVLPFGVLLLVTSVLGAGYLRRGIGHTHGVLAWTTWLALAIIALALISAAWWGLELRDIEKRSRFLALPWTVLWAYALMPERRWLWRGAVAGIWAALVLAIVQVTMGMPRAEGWNNAIVFADVALGLLVIVLLEAGTARWIRGWTLAAAAGVFVLSGSRGVMLGLVALLLVVVWTAHWRTLATRLLLLALLGAAVVTAVISIPELARQARVVELQQDVARLQSGDENSSTGARLERLHVAWATLREHPLVGVGVGRFDVGMRRLPECADGTLERCNLGHAHNDLAEWGATQGIPGALLLILVYALPLCWFVRLYRRSGRREFRGPAATGIVLVVVFALCGLTQSMFAHQLAASFYCVVVGILAGLALREARWNSADRLPPPVP